MIPNLNRNEYNFSDGSIKWEFKAIPSTIEHLPNNDSFIKELEELYKLPESYFSEEIYNSIRSKNYFDSDGSVGAWANNYCSTYSDATKNITVEKIVSLAKDLEESKKLYEDKLDEIFRQIDLKKIKKYTRKNINFIERQVKKSKRKGKSFPFVPPAKPKRINWRNLQKEMQKFYTHIPLTVEREEPKESSITMRMIMANMNPFPVRDNRILITGMI